MKVDLPIFLTTGRETKGTIWFKSNGTRFPLEMLGEATLGVPRVPLNDTCTNRLSEKYLTIKIAKLDAWHYLILYPKTKQCHHRHNIFSSRPIPYLIV